MDEKYTAKWHDVEDIIGAVKGLVFDTDLDHMHIVLYSGCPTNFNWEEPAKNKEVFIRRGSNPSVNKSGEMVQKTMNDKERKSHVLPFPCCMTRASPLGRCTPETIIPGKVNNVNGVKPKHEDDTREICFAIGQGARKVHAYKRTYRIPLLMKEEIEFSRKLLQDNSVPVVTPIGHIIPRDHAWEQASDACKRPGGG